MGRTSDSPSAPNRVDPGARLFKGSSLGHTRPVSRTSITRLSCKASSDRATLDRLLDTVHIGHFAIVADDAHPVVLPTAVVRDGDRVLAHGSTGSRWLRRLAAGAPACLAVTAFDALVVARSAFESSMRYRSAVLFGQCQAITEPDAKRRALDIITDALIPGRSAEVRASTAKELAAVAGPGTADRGVVAEGLGGVARRPARRRGWPGLGRGAARGAALRPATGRAGSARWHTTACLGTAPARQLIGPTTSPPARTVSTAPQ